MFAYVYNNFFRFLVKPCNTSRLFAIYNSFKNDSSLLINIFNNIRSMYHSNDPLSNYCNDECIDSANLL